MSCHFIALLIKFVLKYIVLINVAAVTTFAIVSNHSTDLQISNTIRAVNRDKLINAGESSRVTSQI